MQNLYKPPDAELKSEAPKATSPALFFLVANSGLFVIPTIVLSLLFYSGGISSYGISITNVVGTFLVSAGCSFLASILLLPFRKIRLLLAAIAGSLLSIFFCFVLALLYEL